MSIRIGTLKHEKLETIFVSYPKDIIKLCNILQNNYTKVSAIDQLIALGDIYNLDKTVESTLFYSRDKGDPIEGCKSYEENTESLTSINTNSSPIDYYLIWTNKWNICSAYTNDWTSVKKFLNKKK